MLESQHLEKPGEIWAENETRLELLPVHRRVWTKQGERPIPFGMNLTKTLISNSVPY